MSSSSKLSSGFNAFSSGAKFPDEKRAKHPPPYSIRFTKKERAILTREAQGKSWAEYIREKVFGDSTPRQRGRKNKLNGALLGQALAVLGSSRLSQNMNQIAKAVNIGALPATPELEAELKEACQDIRLMREALISALGVGVEF